MEEIQQELQQFEKSKIIFYIAIWVVGAASGFLRASLDGTYRNYWHLLNIGMVSGTFSFAIVSIAYRWLGSPGIDEFFFTGISALLGLVGMELQSRIGEKVLGSVMEKIGIKDGSKNNDKNKMD